MPFVFRLSFDGNKSFAVFILAANKIRRWNDTKGNGKEKKRERKNKLGNLTLVLWHEANTAESIVPAWWHGAALSEGKELKQQSPCVEEARSRTNRQNIRGSRRATAPAPFERLPTSSRMYQKERRHGRYRRKLRINLRSYTLAAIYKHTHSQIHARPSCSTLLAL